MDSQAIDRHTAEFRARSRMSQSEPPANGTVRAEQISVPVVGEVGRTEAAVAASVVLVLFLLVVVSDEPAGERVVFR